MTLTRMTLFAAAALMVPAAAHAGTVTLVATLSGASEVPPADPDGTGAFSVEINAEAGDFCYSLTVAKIDKATAAHVHAGAAGANGAPVITVEVASDMCIAVEPDVLKAIVAAPEAYYINVHNAAHPGGAVRGQLAKK